MVKNSLLFALSSFGSKLISFFLVPLYTNILTTEDYGAVDLITTSSHLCRFFFSICIMDAVFRYAMEQKADRKGIFLFGEKVMAVGTGILILGTWLAQMLNFVSVPTNYLVYFVAIYIASVYSELALSYLRAIEKIKQVAIISIFTTIITVSTNLIALLVFKLGVNGYLFSLFIGQATTAVIAYVFIHGDLREKNLNRTIGIALKKEMILYSIPLIFNGVSWWVNTSVDKYFILEFFGTSENGIYAVANKIPGILSMFVGFFARAWSISSIKEYKSDDAAFFMGKMYDYYFGALSILSSALIISNVLICRILFAKDFFVAWKYSPTLIIGILFSALAGYLSGIIGANKETKSLASTTIIAAVVNIVLDLLFIPRIGIEGAALATMISFFVMWLCRYIKSYRKMQRGRSIVYDAVIFCALFIQIYLAYSEKQYYILQLIIFILIIVMNMKLVKDISDRSVKYIKSFTQRRRSIE